MFNKLLLCLLVLSLPAAAGAQIHSSVSATSNSGGNTVGSGGTVTVGDSSASVQVTTNSSSSGNSTVNIRTDVNGNVHEETSTSQGATSVKVMATPEKTTIDVQKGTPQTSIRHEVVVPAKAAEASASIVATPAPGTVSIDLQEETGLGTQIILAIQGFFAGVFSWFK